LRARNRVQAEELPAFPALSIRLRDHDPFAAFENLVTTIVGVVDGQVMLQCSNSNHLINAAVMLNFAEERLEFDPVHAVRIFDDGSSEAVRRELDRVRFVRALYGNGQVEVWAAPTNSILGRCDPFIPMNIDFQATDQNLDAIASNLESEATRRAGREASPRGST
jgi:hypothetical protein